MRCTECHKKIKPVVAVDIDGTLGNYHGHFWDHLRGYLGVPVPDPTPAYCGGGGYKDWALREYHIDERTWYDIKLTYRQGALKRTMPAYPYASDLCNGIRSIGAELWITTTRPFQRLDNIDPDTRFWLYHHGIKYDGLLYDEKKYAKLWESVGSNRVVAVLDDLQHELISADMNFGPVGILRRTRWNATVEYPRMVNDLGQAFDMIYSKVEAWNERAQAASAA